MPLKACQLKIEKPGYKKFMFIDKLEDVARLFYKLSEDHCFIWEEILITLEKAV